MACKRKKAVLWLIVAVILSISIIPLEVHAYINDISGYWAEEVVLEWIEKGLANGYSDGNFRPNNEITRAEFMKLTNNAFGFTEEKSINYMDVVEGQWFYDTIQKASANGYITGYEDNTIRPNNPITREEVATIIARIMNLNSKEEGIEDFIDKDDINWSRGYVGAVVSEKYMVGFPDGSFKPQKNITRGEAIYALNNIIGKKEMKDFEAIVKQDFLGITYIHVISNTEDKPLEVKANGQNLTYDKEDRRWKGTTLDLEIGDNVKISIIRSRGEETLTVKVKDMTDS